MRVYIQLNLILLWTAIGCFIQFGLINNRIFIMEQIILKIDEIETFGKSHTI